MLTAGASYLIAFDVHDDTGALANATTVTASIAKPDGTNEAITIPNPPDETGKYRYTYLTEQVGWHSWSAVTTQPNTPYGDVFNVRAYAPMIGLAEAKAHLGAVGPGDEDELRNFLLAATEVVESKVGPCTRRDVTERVYEGSSRLVLTQHPVISVTSVTSVWPGGPSWASAALRVDGDAGIVELAQPGIFWWGPWDVVEMVGRVIIPERFIHAAKEQVKHLWETQRGAAPLLAPVGGEETFTSSAGLTFSIPNRVLELLDIQPSI